MGKKKNKTLPETQATVVSESESIEESAPVESEVVLPEAPAEAAPEVSVPADVFADVSADPVAPAEVLEVEVPGKYKKFH